MLLLACCAYRKIKNLFKSAYTSIFGQSETGNPIELIGKRHDHAQSVRERRHTSTAEEAINFAFRGGNEQLSAPKLKRRAPGIPNKFWSTTTLQAQEIANDDDSFINNRLDCRPSSVEVYDNVSIESSSSVEIDKDGSIEIQLE